MLPALVGAAGEMAPARANWAEQELVRRLRALTDRLAGVDWVEGLIDERQVLDALTGSAREEYDLDGHRAGLQAETHAVFDRLRSDLLEGVEEPVTAAFRLGELLETGALPLCPDLGLSVPTPAAGAGLGFGGTAPASRERPLPLADSPAVPLDRSWPPWWPGHLRSAWEECRLPPSAVTLPAVLSAAATADARRQAVEDLGKQAAAALNPLDRPSAPISDRLRIIEEETRMISLDGRPLVIKHRAAFRIVRALLQAPDFQLTATELKRAPGARATSRRF